MSFLYEAPKETPTHFPHKVSKRAQPEEVKCKSPSHPFNKANTLGDKNVIEALNGFAKRRIGAKFPSGRSSLAQVWASGFSAAFLKKQSMATKGVPDHNSSESCLVMSTNSKEQPKPAILEAALLNILGKFFDVVLNLPAINRRLSDVLERLSTEQPKCPQLYIYSSADRVIPSDRVESFVERQRRAGHAVRACNFGTSPHVDHFRTHPILYSSQLTSFLEDCFPAGNKEDSS